MPAPAAALHRLDSGNGDALTRRGFVVGLAQTSLAVGLMGCATWGRSSRSDELSRRLRAIGAAPGDAGPIASASGWSVAQATDELATTLAAAGTDEALRADLRARIRNDYASDRIRSVDGWWLSDSEIAIAVLVAAGQP